MADVVRSDGTRVRCRRCRHMHDRAYTTEVRGKPGCRESNGCSPGRYCPSCVEAMPAPTAAEDRKHVREYAHMMHETKMCEGTPGFCGVKACA